MLPLFKTPSPDQMAQRHLDDAKHGLLNAYAREEQAKAAVAEAQAAVALYQSRIARLEFALK